MNWRRLSTQEDANVEFLRFAELIVCLGRNTKMASAGLVALDGQFCCQRHRIFDFFQTTAQAFASDSIIEGDAYFVSVLRMG